MPRRSILSAAERGSLLALPEGKDELILLKQLIREFIRSKFSAAPVVFSKPVLALAWRL